jgi:DNA-binding CsgD family transcriptional regulator
MASWMRTSIDAQFYRELVDAAGRLDASEYLSLIEAPTLVVYRDDYDPFAAVFCDSVADQIPGSQRALIDYGDNNLAARIMTFIGPAGLTTAEPPSAPVPEPQPTRDLTPREAQILRLLSKGRHNKEIAVELGLSVYTVERHIATIYAKTGVRGRVDAVWYALENGLVDYASS